MEDRDPQYDWEGQHDWRVSLIGGYLRAIGDNYIARKCSPDWSELARALVKAKDGYRRGNYRWDYESKSPDMSLADVSDQNSFIDFLRNLADEREEVDGSQFRESHNWECHSITAYLRSCAAKFQCPQASDQPQWKTLAEFLIGGKRSSIRCLTD